VARSVRGVQEARQELMLSLTRRCTRPTPKRPTRPHRKARSCDGRSRCCLCRAPSDLSRERALPILRQLVRLLRKLRRREGW
jgi:hypothetical protein